MKSTLKLSVVILSICIQTRASSNVSTYFIDILNSNDKFITSNVLDQVMTYINSQLIASGSALRLRRHTVTKQKDVFKNAYSLSSSNVIALIDIAEEHDFIGCISSTLTNIPIFGIIDKANHQMRKLRFCPRSIAFSADYMDYAHASITILDSFHWKKVALLYEENHFYQAAYFQSITARKGYNVRLIQMLTHSNLTNEDKACQVMYKLAANDVDVILLYTSETVTNTLLTTRACSPKKIYIWIIQESVPIFINAHSSHMIVGFQLSRNRTMLPKTLQNNNTSRQDCLHLIFDSVTSVSMATAHLQNLSLWLPGNSTKDLGINRERLYNQATKIGFHGHTGTVKVDSTGRRQLETLEILNLRDNKFVKIGEWRKSSRQHSLVDGILPNVVKRLDANILQGRKLSVAVMMLEPFVTKTTNTDGTIQYSGFCVDLLKKLASDLKFCYEIHESLDGNYGSYSNGKWNGMVKELIEGKADMIVSDLTITEAREKVIDFTASYMYYTEDIAVKRNETKSYDYLQFLRPFDVGVWLVLLVVLVVFSFILFLFNYLSPYGWENESGEKTSKEFSLLNCFWFSWSSMLQQGAEYKPKSVSGLLLVGFLWFYVLLCVSAYTANLATFFTLFSIKIPIKNLEDAIKSDDYEIGVSNRSHLVDFFKSTKVQRYQRLWKKMDKLPTNNMEGMKWTREKKYIHLGNGPILNFQASKKPCELVTFPGIETPQSYGLALRNGDPHVQEISLGILHLRGTGFLEKLKRKYWSINNDCTPELSKMQYPEIGRTSTVEFSSLAGVFILLLLGIVLSVITLMIEIYCSSRKLKNNPNSSTKRDNSRSNEIGNDNHITVEDNIPPEQAENHIAMDDGNMIQEYQDGKEYSLRTKRQCKKSPEMGVGKGNGSESHEHAIITEKAQCGGEREGRSQGWNNQEVSERDKEFGESQDISDGKGSYDERISPEMSEIREWGGESQAKSYVKDHVGDSPNISDGEDSQEERTRLEMSAIEDQAGETQYVSKMKDLGGDQDMSNSKDQIIDIELQGRI